jgi:hypothetical protein
MTGSGYAVVFTGRLVDGAAPEQVKARFAQLFKVDVAKVAPMFTGRPVTIKKGLDEATARKYQQALQQAGAVCEVVDQAAPPAAATQGASGPGSPGPGPSAAGLDASLAEPGALLKEPDRVEALQVETSHLSIGEAGVTLVEPEAVAELAIDLSALSMAEAGVQLVPPTPVTPLEVDISGLSLVDP